MRLKIEHVTSFSYDAPAYETATELRLQPRDDLGSPQRCLDFDVTITPTATVFNYVDFYGNRVHHFNLMQSLRELKIEARCTVETGLGWSPSTPKDRIVMPDFLAECRYVHFDAAVRVFADQFRTIGNTRDLAYAVAEKIYQSFTYEPGVTGVHSTSAEVMALGRGVCQDFAHIMLAVCRLLDVPARYVSGYLYGGAESEEHDRASHAWCEIFDSTDNVWYAYDPTHNNLIVDDRYVRIGTGRDYADVTLVRGTYKGNSNEKLEATVRVSRLA
jgi:transglutaminase-like putative cysteine protease